MSISDFCLIESIIAHREIATLFQPIVDVAKRRIVGYEALSRGPRLSPLESPIALFDAAAEHGLLWELEYTSRSLAIERASRAGLGSTLFLNVDPRVIFDHRFAEGFTHELLRKHGMKPSQVVIEITERISISDFTAFRSVMGHYTSQGYQIAIDDVGAGYSGLLTVAEAMPHYIKLDMSLVRDIHKSQLKQAICRSMVELCRSTGMKLIAEGVETSEELSALLRMDVSLVQGYLFGRPCEVIPQFTDEMAGILASASISSGVTLRDNSVYPIGRLAKPGVVVDSPTSAEYVMKMFDRHGTNSVVVVHAQEPKGLIMASFLSGMLSSRLGYSVSLYRGVESIMDTDYMVVDYNTPLSVVTRDAMARNERRLYDHIVITKHGFYHGIVSVMDLVLKLGEFYLEHAKHLNPLTGLPGNALIERNY